MPLWKNINWEGTDPSERYFNRLVPIKRVEGGYNGSIMYEALTLDSQVHRTVQETTKDIADQLRALGFTKMRTRLNFKGQNTSPKKKPGWSILTSKFLNPFLPKPFAP